MTMHVIYTYNPLIIPPQKKGRVNFFSFEFNILIPCRQMLARNVFYSINP